MHTGFVPDEDGDWRLGVVGLGTLRARPSTARPCSRRPRSRRSSTSTRSSRSPPQYDDRRSRWRAGQRVDVRIRYRWPADGFIFRVGLRRGPAAAAGRRGARARRRARPHQRRRGRRRRHLSDDVESEGFDRTSLALPGRQDELVRAVAAANPRTVVVVNAGAPVELPWRDEVAAVLVSWFPGMEFGNALADVLLGASSPAAGCPRPGRPRWPTPRCSRSTPDRRAARVHRGPRHRAPRLPGAPAPSRRTGSATASATRPGSTSRSTPRRGRRRRASTARVRRAQHRRPPRQAGRAGLRLPPGLGRRAAGRAGSPASPSSRRARARWSRCRSTIHARALRHWDVAARLGRRARRPDAVRRPRAPATCVASATVSLVVTVTRPARPAGRAPRRAARHPDDGAAAVLAAARRRPRAARPTGSPPTTAGTPAGSTATRACWCPTPARRWRPSQRVEWRVQVAHRPGREPGVGAGLVRDRPALGRGLAGVLDRARARCRTGRRASGRRRCCGSSSTSTGRSCRARLHATAQGIYEAFLNGERVGDAELTPGFTQYDARLQVQTYDVTGVGPRRAATRSASSSPTAGSAGRSASPARPTSGATGWRCWRSCT